jgi:DNA-binding NtrC family response regulator
VPDLRILLVDDDPDFCRHFEVLAAGDFVVVTVAGYDECLEYLERHTIDAVLLDIELGEARTGVDLLRDVRHRHPDLPVIMVSADDAQETIVAATKAGADGYVSKHPDLDILKVKIEKALDDSAWRRHARDLQRAGVRLVGSSRAMEALRREIDRVARSSVRVLIRGERGSGKEVVALCLHEASDRKHGRFVAMNAASESDEMFEAELYGHERGAFTGAVGDRTGLLELAQNGTFFLDEVGKMSLARQAKLLRVIETSEFKRIGGTRRIEGDFRWITATNDDLGEMANRGDFLPDFYDRIRVFEILVPPLRERLDDIPELARHLLDAFATRERRPRVGVADDAVGALQEYAWPGNVRELDTVLQRASVFSASDRLTAEDVRAALGGAVSGVSPNGATVGQGAAPLTLDAARREFERAFVLQALMRHGWDVGATARTVGVPRSSLYRVVKELGIELPSQG